MLRVHVDNFVPKYKNGKWKWNNENDCVEFEKNPEFSAKLKKNFIEAGIYNFKLSIDEVEELIFRQEFQRPKTDKDADVITMQDIKDVVLYLSPMEIVSNKFIKFMHMKNVDKVIHALIIYMEHFLKFVEFLMIFRDNCEGEKNAQLQSEESNDIKRIYSEYLTQYRLLLARDYSAIILGEGEMKPFYHIKPIINISMAITDKTFYDAFIDVMQQIVWIALHRRAYDIIDYEIGRLFRTEHFMTPKPDAIEFTINEKSMLYGKNYKILNYRQQTSPLMQELSNVAPKNLPILWIGERKYRGNDLRIHQLEMEYIVPESQLLCIECVHGILGHPKKLYNTLLSLEPEALRIANFSEIYDPYHIIRQPTLEIPKLDAEKIREKAVTLESFYRIESYWKPLSKAMFKKWADRDGIISYFKTEGVLDDIWTRARDELESNSNIPSIDGIIKEIRGGTKDLI